MQIITKNKPQKFIRHQSSPPNHAAANAGQKRELSLARRHRRIGAISHLHIIVRVARYVAALKPPSGNTTVENHAFRIAVVDPAAAIMWKASIRRKTEEGA